MKYRGYGQDHTEYMQRQQEIYLKALALQPKVSTPKSWTMFVIKILESRIKARVGGYVSVTSNELFNLETELKYATRFPTFDAAFKAIDVRNAGRSDTSERYAVAKVKVVETPAVAAETKTVTVPGVKGYALKAVGFEMDRYVTFVNGPTSGSASYTDRLQDAHVFPTLERAASWLEARSNSVYAPYGMAFTITLVTTPSTSTTKTIREAQPASTVVTLA